jgi:tRNA A37 methylthiotransferase MiaB
MAFIAVVGCYAQLKPEEIAAIPGVDLVLGANEKFDLAAHIEAPGAPWEASGHGRQQAWHYGRSPSRR